MLRAVRLQKPEETHSHTNTRLIKTNENELANVQTKRKLSRRCRPECSDWSQFGIVCKTTAESIRALQVPISPRPVPDGGAASQRHQLGRRRKWEDVSGVNRV